jgi:hypothetical protein
MDRVLSPNSKLSVRSTPDTGTEVILCVPYGTRKRVAAVALPIDMTDQATIAS